MSDAAHKVLVHLARARAAVDIGDPAVASENLHQAKRLVCIIRGALPTTRIRERIASIRARLSYEDTEVISKDLVPVMEELDVI